MPSETPKEAVEAATPVPEPATIPTQDDAEKKPEAEKEIDRTEIDKMPRFTPKICLDLASVTANFLHELGPLRSMMSKTLDTQLQRMGYLADDVKFFLDEYDNVDGSTSYVTIRPRPGLSSRRTAMHLTHQALILLNLTFRRRISTAGLNERPWKTGRSSRLHLSPLTRRLQPSSKPFTSDSTEIWQLCLARGRPRPGARASGRIPYR
jgi:hypothetical protein